MMEVQQQHSPVCVGPLDFSRRGVAEASAFRVVKPKQPPSSFVNQQPHTNETNNNQNIQEHTRIPIETREYILFSILTNLSIIYLFFFPFHTQKNWEKNVFQFSIHTKVHV